MLPAAGRVISGEPNGMGQRRKSTKFTGGNAENHPAQDEGTSGPWSLARADSVEDWLRAGGLSDRQRNPSRSCVLAGAVP
jgi:hypothetical protein